MVANKLNEQKRQHRERAQPLARAKLGLLEKHQDYVKRARDYHSKEDRLNKLREKASGRNKDEFYFGMIKSRTKKGIHVQSREAQVLPIDLVKVLKTQDAAYIRTQKAIEESKVKRLQEELEVLVDLEEGGDPLGQEHDDSDLMLDDWDAFDSAPVASTSSSSAGPKRNHIVFTDNLELVQNPDTKKLLSKRKPIASKGKGKATAVAPPPLTPEEISERQAAFATHKSSLLTLLSARQSRLSSLSLALRELELQKAVMGKGAKSLVPSKARKGGGKEGDEMGWREDDDDGNKSGKEKRREKVDGMSHGVGVGTGARVWKWKQERKR